MRWRKLCEETPSLGQECICRRDWGSVDTDEYLDAEYANLWCPIGEIEAIMDKESQT